MTTSNPVLTMNCLNIEAMIRVMVMTGITDNAKLVEAVDNIYQPSTREEQELYSEAIIYAKQGVLN